MQGFETALQGLGSRCKVIQTPLRGIRKSMQGFLKSMQGNPDGGARISEGRPDDAEVAARSLKCRCKVIETAMQGLPL
jgi:hypothetical protein